MRHTDISPEPVNDKLFLKVFKGMRIGAYIFLAFAGLNIAFSIILLIHGNKAEAVVVDIEFGSTHNSKTGTSSTTYKPVFQYQYEGETHIIMPTFSSNVVNYYKGDKAIVYISTYDRHWIKVNCFLDMWLVPIILSFVGTIFYVFAWMGSRLFAFHNKMFGRLGAGKNTYQEFHFYPIDQKF